MIVRSDIEDVVREFLEEDAWQLITVGMVYHAMKKRGKCCGCFPNAIGIIVAYSEHWHRLNDTPSAQIFSLVERIKSEHNRMENIKKQLAKNKRTLAA